MPHDKFFLFASKSVLGNVCCLTGPLERDTNRFCVPFLLLLVHLSSFGLTLVFSVKAE